jgi:hypothetical protein
MSSSFSVERPSIGQTEGRSLERVNYSRGRISKAVKLSPSPFVMALRSDRMNPFARVTSLIVDEHLAGE